MQLKIKKLDKLRLAKKAQSHLLSQSAFLEVSFQLEYIQIVNIQLMYKVIDGFDVIWI